MGFEIGPTLGSMVTIEALLGRDKDPKPTFHPFAVIRPMASGKDKGRGSPTATWDFGFLRQSETDALATIIPIPSGPVFIRTPSNRNSDEFKLFQTIAHWPEDEGDHKVATRRLNFIIRYTQMIEQEE
jgi:hypothetical protein